ELVGTGYNYGPYWAWGGGWSTPTVYNTWVTKLGTLVVEISDAKQKELLWRGSVTDTITDNSNKNIKNLDNAVAKLFKGYPPNSKTKKCEIQECDWPITLTITVRGESEPPTT